MQSENWKRYQKCFCYAQPLFSFTIISRLLSYFRAFRNGSERQSSVTWNPLTTTTKVPSKQISSRLCDILRRTRSSLRFIESHDDAGENYMHSSNIALSDCLVLHNWNCIGKYWRCARDGLKKRFTHGNTLNEWCAICNADYLVQFQFTEVLFLFRCGRFSWVDCPWTQNHGNFTYYSELMR